MQIPKREKIKNTFFDTISLILSFFWAIPRSIFLLFSNTTEKKRNYFFDFLDFFFRVWPKYFFQKPSGIKLTSFFADFWKYLFK